MERRSAVLSHLWWSGAKRPHLRVISGERRRMEEGGVVRGTLGGHMFGVHILITMVTRKRTSRDRAPTPTHSLSRRVRVRLKETGICHFVITWQIISVMSVLELVNELQTDSVCSSVTDSPQDLCVFLISRFHFSVLCFDVTLRCLLLPKSSLSRWNQPATTWQPEGRSQQKQIICLMMTHMMIDPDGWSINIQHSCDFLRVFEMYVLTKRPVSKQVKRFGESC